MGKIVSLAATLIALLPLASIAQPVAPQPFGALPSDRQMAWHQLDYYAFVHFNINTFSGEEWGHGTENPAIFNPTTLDCRQWARTCKEAGMKGIIITAKHHDGFCMFDAHNTEWKVTNTPYGKDVLAKLTKAFEKHGVRVGYYYSKTSDDIAPFINTIFGGFGDGQGVEMFYNIATGKRLTITPDMQVLVPSREQLDTALVVGLRANYNF